MILEGQRPLSIITIRACGGIAEIIANLAMIFKQPVHCVN